MLTTIDVFGIRAFAPTLLLNPKGSAGTDPIQILDIQGLGPVKADITTAAYAVFDGEYYVGANVGKRNIVMKVGLNPDWATQSMGELRNILYNYFMPKLFTRLQFRSTHLPACQIDGYVESVEPDMFSKDPQMQVSILCPRPEFVAIDPITVTGHTNDGSTEDDFTVFNYAGSIPAGFILKVSLSTGTPGEDTVELILDSEYDRQTFEAQGEISDTSYFEMSSVPGRKYVRSVTVDDPDTYVNYLKTLAADAIWPVLNPNTNKLAVVTPVVGQDWELRYFARFGGL